jgi:hypothetical protein
MVEVIELEANLTKDLEEEFDGDLNMKKLLIYVIHSGYTTNIPFVYIL